MKNTKINQLIQNITTNYQQAMQLGLWGAGGGALGSIINEIFSFQNSNTTTFIELIISIGIWFGIMGTCISVSLLLGYSWYLKRGLKWFESVKSGAIPGFISGLISGAIAQGIFNLNTSELSRVICWGIAGGLLGLGLSFCIPNLGRWRGLIGGLIGGIIGGCLFILFTFLLGEIIGRLIGISAIGFLIGLMIILVETAFRKAWLIIHWETTKEEKTISLGDKPIILGSASNCHIYLPPSQGYLPMTAKIHLDKQKVFINFHPEYNPNMQKLTHELVNGEKRKLGNVIIEVKTSQ